MANGGAERVATLWAQMLSHAGYAVTVVTHYPHANAYPLDAKITQVNLLPDQATYQALKYKKATCQKLLEQYLATHPQDLVIPFLINNNLLTTLSAHIPCVLTQTVRNSPWDKEAPLEQALRDWAIQKQGSVILQNDEQRAYFTKPAFRHVKQYVVHNPLNPAIENLQKTTYRPVQRLVAVGRLVAQKNHALMIEALRILRDEFQVDYALDIYGSGELQPVLQAQIDAAGLNEHVKLCGRKRELFPRLLDYDLFLLTSCYEGTPNALLEAMGLGLPCLAIKCRTGITELIDNGKNGYILDSYDPHVLAQKIYSLSQADDLARIGEQARMDMRRYRLDQIQTELVAVVEDLLRHPPRTTDRGIHPDDRPANDLWN